MTKKIAVLNDYGIVVNIIVCDDDTPETEKFVAYSEDNPAYIDGDYLDGYFYAEKPFPSWIRNLGNWESPTTYPSGDGIYQWVEDDLNWQLVEGV